MNKPTYIYGASGKTRLIIDFLKNENQLDIIQGIIDNDSQKIGESYYGIPVISNLEGFLKEYNSKKVDFCISLSENNLSGRLNLYLDFLDKGYTPKSIISKIAQISLSARVGMGAIIFPEVLINAFATIGRCVTIYTGALIEHDCYISDNVEISPRCVLAGGVHIDQEVFIGINATILPHVKVGRNSIIGAGSVVTKDVPENSVMVGNPAKFIRHKAP